MLFSLAASGYAASSAINTASDVCPPAAQCSGSIPSCAARRRASERAHARTRRGAAWRVERAGWAHLVLLLGRLWVRRQQRRHHRLRRLVLRGKVQRQLPTLCASRWEVSSEQVVRPAQAKPKQG